MSDLFHEQVPDHFRVQVFAVMNDLPWHRFVILTKRPQPLTEWGGLWSENIWMGVSVENADYLWRIDNLRKCRASKKVVSFEPLIGRIGKIDLNGIDWVTVGGEFAPEKKRRSMDESWAREIRDQCVASGIPFFFKQHDGTAQGTKPYLIEDDGSHSFWRQYPNDEFLTAGARTNGARS
jgi:protein gp37